MLVLMQGIQSRMSVRARKSLEEREAWSRWRYAEVVSILMSHESRRLGSNVLCIERGPQGSESSRLHQHPGQSPWSGGGDLKNPRLRMTQH